MPGTWQVVNKWRELWLLQVGSGKAEGIDWGSAREQMFESVSTLSKESD